MVPTDPQPELALDRWRLTLLTHSCRAAKERLLGDPDAEAVPIVVPSRGRKLVGGSIRSELTRAEVESVLTRGFFPKVEARARPETRTRAALSLRPALLRLLTALAFRHMTPIFRHMTKQQLLEAYATFAGTSASEPLRIARLLSLKVDSEFDDVALAARVAAGLPCRSVSSLAAVFGKSKIIEHVVPEATLRRVRKARRPLPKQHSESVYEMSLLIDLLGRTFRGDVEKMRAFLLRPHVLLGGDTPLDMTRSSSAGARAVRKLLQRAEAGVAL